MEAEVVDDLEVYCRVERDHHEGFPADVTMNGGLLVHGFNRRTFLNAFEIN